MRPLATLPRAAWRFPAAVLALAAPRFPAAALALAALLFPAAALAFTWIVDPAGGGHALTIQGAVDFASEHDEILVRAGTYPEEVVLDVSLAIRGESGAAATTIDAASVRATCIRSAGSIGGTLLEGLTFTGVNGGYGYCVGRSAVSIQGGLTIQDCVFENNSCSATTVESQGDLVVLDTRFSGNFGQGWVCGQTDPDHGTGCIQVIGSLFAQRCVFENNGASDNAVLDVFGSAYLADCVFRGNSSPGIAGGGLFVSSWGGATVQLESNLFHGNGPGTLLFGYLFYGGGEPILAEVRRNTFADNPGLFGQDPNLAPGSIFEANVFTGSDAGLRLPEGGGFTAICNDAWGNAENFVGFDPGAGANFSAAPHYCDAPAGNFTVATNSPLLPANNSCGVGIGAFGVGCGPVSIEATTWGRVKNAYRTGAGRADR